MRIPDVVPLFNEHFTERHVLYVLYHLSVQVGDVAAAQIICLVIVLQFSKASPYWMLSSISFAWHVSVLLQSSRRHSRFFAVYIVLVVRSVVRHLKVNTIFFDCILMCRIFSVIVLMASASLPEYCMRLGSDP